MFKFPNKKKRRPEDMFGWGLKSKNEQNETIKRNYKNNYHPMTPEYIYWIHNYKQEIESLLSLRNTILSMQHKKIPEEDILYWFNYEENKIITQIMGPTKISIKEILKQIADMLSSFEEKERCFQEEYEQLKKTVKNEYKARNLLAYIRFLEEMIIGEPTSEYPLKYK